MFFESSRFPKRVFLLKNYEHFGRLQEMKCLCITVGDFDPDLLQKSEVLHFYCLALTRILCKQMLDAPVFVPNEWNPI